MCVYIYVFVYIHLFKAYFPIKISLSMPWVHSFQKLYLHLQLRIGRMKNSFHIVTTQKLQSILKIVFM